MLNEVVAIIIIDFICLLLSDTTTWTFWNLKTLIWLLLNWCSFRYRSMYFPIRKYIRWQSGPIYIPFVNMIRIFSYVSESGGDWATALRSNISLRYLRTMEERIEKMRPERFQDKMEAKAKIVHIQQLVMEAIGPASPPPKIDDLQSFLYPLRAPVHVRLPEPHSRKLKGERRS